jgi:hypothetical protein
LFQIAEMTGFKPAADSTAQQAKVDDPAAH